MVKGWMLGFVTLENTVIRYRLSSNLMLTTFKEKRKAKIVYIKWEKGEYRIKMKRKIGSQRKVTCI